MILDTDPIINPENVNIQLADSTIIDEGKDIKDILKDNGSSVTLKTQSDEQISKDNPLSVKLDLDEMTGSSTKVEQVVIKSSGENAPTSGSVVIPKAGDNGEDLVVNFNTATARSASQDRYSYRLRKTSCSK